MPATAKSHRTRPAEAAENRGTIIAIYARISSDRDNDADGVRRQQARCRRLADKLAAEFPDRTVEVYEDNDLSADPAKANRPEYARLVADITAGRVAIVLAWTTSRLNRDRDESSDLVRSLRATATQVETIKGGRYNLETAAGRAQFFNEANTNQLERETISENTLESKLDAAELGQWRGGTVPLGYVREGKYSLAKDPAAAAAVLEAAEAVLAGQSLSAATRMLNARLGRTMRPGAVRGLLMRRSIAGLVERYGEVVAEAGWDGIITRQQSDDLIELLSDPRRNSSPGPTRQHLGSGLFLSPAGAKVRSGSGSRKVRGDAVTNYWAPGVSKRIDLVDTYVLAVIAERLADPTVVAALVARSAPQMSATRIELETLQARVRNTVALYNEGVITLEDMTAGTRKSRTRIQELEAELAAAAKVSPAHRVLTADKPSEFFLTSDVDTQRAVIGLLCDVVLHPTGGGRPKGWTKGASYFDQASVEFRWR